MRLKVFATIMIGAASLLLILAGLRLAHGKAIASVAVPAATGEESPGAVKNLPANEDFVAEHRTNPVSPARPISQPQNIAAAESDASANRTAARIAQLQELGMADDAGSLNDILGDLENPDPQIREAALQATVQFGSRDAIPRLKELAARTEDPQARRALEDAAEFLTLPSLTEIIENHERAARR